ncbi:MAG: NnrS family protein, partial [Gammaproteobacteria bacterium]|nr:NnrS family protein [Gammaproteobacteria bacterium]
GPEMYHLSSLNWHAHEMIYGYTMAVVSGFLLTATTNWTSRKTLTGLSLFVASLFWLLARVSPFLDFHQNIAMMFLFDTLFFIMLIVGISRPVIQSRQWKQLPVILPVVLLLLTNSLFYMGQLELINDGIRIGLYAGFYLLLALIFVMGRRVIPFFIEKGVENGFVPVNYLWLDKLVLPIFITYALSEVFLLNKFIIVVLASILFILSMIRLAGWYTKGVWGKSLLWILLLAYLFITIGFGLRAASYFINIPDVLVLHSFAVGGVAMLTVGMMSRVALGHSGRNVFEPPAAIVWIFILISIAVVFRVVFPLFSMTYYSQWIMISQVFWIAAFSLFAILYSGMLIKPRLDGRPG